MKKIGQEIKKASPSAGMLTKKPISHGVGRRKSAVARVWIRHGNGTITVNNKEFVNYCITETARKSVQEPLVLLNLENDFSIDVNVRGGGTHSQADAIKLGISRALVEYNENHKPALRAAGLLTVDSRLKERKKYGQRGARRKFQFVKR
jgi:small subunit ribosomal protein S9